MSPKIKLSILKKMSSNDVKDEETFPVDFKSDIVTLLRIN
jgi:hypothetical protein